MLLTKQTINNFEHWLETAVETGAAILIDKDLGWTSFDVVAKLRSITKIRKIGHAGTLDPLATGLLILCLGKATKKISDFQDMKKEYSCRIKLGATTKTFDSEGDEENIIDITHLEIEDIIAAVMQFVGKIEQKIPNFSAKKIGGKKLYQLARKNIVIPVTSNFVEIYKIDIIEINKPFVSFNVVCSKGTYIRSLANEIGEKLGCGAYLAELRRTAIGEFKAEDSLKISEIIELAGRKQIDQEL